MELGQALRPPLSPGAHGHSIRKLDSGLRQDWHDFLKPMAQLDGGRGEGDYIIESVAAPLAGKGSRPSML